MKFKVIKERKKEDSNYKLTYNTMCEIILYKCASKQTNTTVMRLKFNIC